MTVTGIARATPAANEDILMLFDETDSPLSEEELLSVKENARIRLHIWQTRALYSTGALLLSSASVYPFLQGNSLHSYWDMVGKYLVMLSMALLLVFVYCTGLWWGAWRALHDLDNKGQG
jgi:hypothetical protein